MNSLIFHAVKTATLAETAKRYGLQGADTLKRIGTAAFSEHRLPEWTKHLPKGVSGPAQVHTGYGPGPIDSFRSDPTASLKNKLIAAAGGAGNTLKDVGHSVGEFGREMTLGSPITAGQAFKKRVQEHGVSKALGGQVRDYYAHPDLNPLAKGLNLKSRAGRLGGLALSAGLPAFQLHSAITGPSETRGESTGGALGGILTAPFTARLGIPGMALQGLGQQLGARAGRAIDHLRNPAPTIQPTRLLT